MPTPATSELFTPKSWDEFEDIVWNIYSRIWRDLHAQRNGRNGQRQHGVDTYGRPVYLNGKYAGIQCKRYSDANLTQKKIDDDIVEAEKFEPVLAEYIIATTEHRDVKLQEFVRKLNIERESEGKFSVHIVFWEELCDHLANPNNYDLLKKYYGEWQHVFTQGSQTLRDEQYHIALNWNGETRMRSFDLSGRDLSSIELINADLIKTNLDDTNLYQVNLSNAKLNNAKLRRANLFMADLRGADLSEADLRNADLNESKLERVHLYRADLSEASLASTDLRRANLFGVCMCEANLKSAELTEASLRLANLKGADLEGASLDDTDLYKANLEGAILYHASLWRADLRGANLKGADLEEASLDDANLQKANLEGAILHNASLRRADLRGANLSKVDLSGNSEFGIDLREIKFDEDTVWPEGYYPTQSAI